MALGGSGPASAAIAAGARNLYHAAVLGSGFMAQSLCSGIFVSKRDRGTRISWMGDKAGFAAAKPLSHPPGSTWHYSGGASNTIARVIRRCFANVRFPRAELAPERNVRRRSRVGVQIDADLLV
jgi:hypothetical protein